MTLSDGEIRRIKFELGYTMVSAGAEPYISVTAVFEEVIQDNLEVGSVTTSSTVVAAASTPTPVVLTLASATGFSASSRVFVDVDGRHEVATIQSISSNDITVLLSLAHGDGVSTSYPVATEDGESWVRQILRSLDKVRERIGGPGASGNASTVGLTAAGIKQVDEIIFSDASSGSNGGSTFADLASQIDYWREELATALGVRNLRALGMNAGGSGGGGGGIVELY